MRLDFKHFGDSLQSTGITCDLSLTNSLGIRNSKLIAFLCKLEPKFQTLAIVLRFWAKLNGFIGSSQMSSYAFSMLIVFFCQNLNPPLLPTIELSAPNKNLIINGIKSWFCSHIDLYRMSSSQEDNDLSVKDLLPLFVEYYAHFDFENRIICPRNGKVITKRKLKNKSVIVIFKTVLKNFRSN